MAYVGYTPPTSWTDGGMDWANPDPADRRYLHAILLALAERYESAVWKASGAYGRPAAWAYAYNAAGPCDPFSVRIAERIADRIRRLFAWYLVANPDAEAAVRTAPYVEIRAVEDNDANYKLLNVAAGGLLSGSATVNFFKACYHFLNRCTITYPVVPLIYDLTHGTDVPDPYYASWSAAWAGWMAVADTDSDTTGRTLEWEFTGTTRYPWARGISLPNNVRFLPESQLAQKLLINYRDGFSAIGDPVRYNIGWDAIGHGWAQGVNEVLIPSGGAEVQIAGDTLSQPSAYVAWDNPSVPEELDTDEQWRYNTRYNSSATLVAVDFATPGGFKFYEPEEE